METNLEMTLKKKNAYKNIILGISEISLILSKKDNYLNNNDYPVQEILNLLGKFTDISESPQELKSLLTQLNACKNTYSEDINKCITLIREGLASLATASMHKSQQNL